MHDAASPYNAVYNEEIVFSISDWYHEQMPDMMPHYLHQSMLHDPTPDSNLINDTQNLQIPVRPNEKYLVRIANIGGFMGQYVSIEDHEMTIVEVDGVYTKRAQAQTIYIAAGQRYGVLIEGKDNASRNYAITVTMDKVCLTWTVDAGSVADLLLQDLDYDGPLATSSHRYRVVSLRSAPVTRRTIRRHRHLPSN